MLWIIFIFNKSKRYQRPNIKKKDQTYQLVPCYYVSKMSVSFRYKLKHLCNVLSWSASLRYQLVHHCDVSNWSILFTYQWDVAKTCQIGPSYWRTNLRRCDDVSVWSRIFKLVTKIGQFFLGSRQTVHFFYISSSSVSLRTC